jgi:hypothetical protein
MSIDMWPTYLVFVILAIGILMIISDYLMFRKGIRKKGLMITQLFLVVVNIFLAIVFFG